MYREMADLTSMTMLVFCLLIISTLVGSGAYEWAKRNNIETIKQDELITGNRYFD